MKITNINKYSKVIIKIRLNKKKTNKQTKKCKTVNMYIRGAFPPEKFYVRKTFQWVLQEL